MKKNKIFLLIIFVFSSTFLVETFAQTCTGNKSNPENKKCPSNDPSVPQNACDAFQQHINNAIQDGVETARSLVPTTNGENKGGSAYNHAVEAASTLPSCVKEIFDQMKSGYRIPDNTKPKYSSKPSDNK